MSLRCVHTQEGGVIEGCGLLLRIMIVTRCTDVGAGGGQTLEGDRRVREEWDNANLDIEFAEFFNSS